MNESLKKNRMYTSAVKCGWLKLSLAFSCLSELIWYYICPSFLLLLSCQPATETHFVTIYPKEMQAAKELYLCSSLNLHHRFLDFVLEVLSHSKPC